MNTRALCPTFTARARLIWFAGGFCILHFGWHGKHIQIARGLISSNLITQISGGYAILMYLRSKWIQLLLWRTHPPPPFPLSYSPALYTLSAHLSFICLLSFCVPLRMALRSHALKASMRGHPLHKSLDLQRITRFPDYMLTSSKRTD